MNGNYTLTARTVSECENFLKIKWKDEEYQAIDKFIEGGAFLHIYIITILDFFPADNLDVARAYYL